MVEPAIQLYTLREIDEPIHETIERVGETNYRGVEFGGREPESLSAVATALEESGLAVTAGHADIDRLEDRYDEVIRDYETIGCPRIVVPSYDSDAFTMRDRVDDVAARLSALAERLNADGFDFSYHNHGYEFTDLGGETGFDRLVEQTSDLVTFEIDTGLAKAAGVDPVDLIRRHGDSTPLVHLSDTRNGSERTAHVELGGGEVDLEGCLNAIHDTDIEWLIYEHGQTTDPLASLEHSESRLTSLLCD